MALKLLQPGTQPLGQFDGKDDEVLTLKGGEVVTFGQTLLTAGDKAASDAFDGYFLPATPARPYITKTLTAGKRPLMLADDGIAGYGTLFGTVVGGTVGQVSTGGTVLGPHTATGSGKVTCWDKPGLYAVSLDACDGFDGSNPTTSLQPTNTTLTAGAALYPTTAGLLTPATGRATATTDIVGRFVEFTTNGSLVNTPNYLVSALNSPSDTTPGQRQFAFAVFAFTPPN